MKVEFIIKLYYLNLAIFSDLSWLVSQGPYDVVLLPGGMPGAQNLAEVRKCEINGVEREASLHNSTELILMVAQSFLFLILYR